MGHVAPLIFWGALVIKLWDAKEKDGAAIAPAVEAQHCNSIIIVGKMQ